MTGNSSVRVALEHDVPPGSVLAWRRVGFAVIVALPFGLLLSLWSKAPTGTWVVRSTIVALLAVVAFGVAERVPARLPRVLARWVLQLVAVVVAVPLGVYLAHWLTSGVGIQPRPEQLRFLALCFMGVLFGPWIALIAMLRQRDALAQRQALTFQLERSEFERQGLQARLRLLQAQVQPHFLFNTLANIRALVRSASPQAPAVLDSLIAYLRAAVPRLDGTSTTVGEEVQLVRAYLQLMQMRMPDRLQFSLDVDASSTHLLCPPMALLTLVENAVRHGIDPAEQGGRIEVKVTLRLGRCHACVLDSGVGLVGAGGAQGTGLATLRERLQLAFGDQAELRVSAVAPHGVRAELEFPAEMAQVQTPT